MSATALRLPAILEQSPSLRHDFAWTLAGNSVFAACQWGAVMALAKLSSTAAVGQFALGMAVTAPIFLFSNLSLRTVLATDGGGQFAFRAYRRLRLLTTAAALSLALTIAVAGGYRPETAMFIGVVGLSKAIESVSDIYYGLRQLQGCMRRIAISMILRSVGSLAALVGILAMGGSPVTAVAATVVVWLAILLGYDMSSAAPEHSSPLQATGGQALLGMARSSLPLGLTAMLLSFNTNIPRYFLDRRGSESAVGIYSALALFAVAGGTVMNAIGQSVMTRLADAYREGRRKEFLHLLSKLGGAAAGLGGLGIAVSALAGREILLLFYRSEYAEHATVLALLMFAGAIQCFGSCLGFAVTAMRLFRVQMWIHSATSVVTLACAWPLIQKWGLAGAAWSSIAGSACAAVPYGVIAYRKLKAWQ
jgi:O-antigen/teichoic acid export membrane protein